MNKIPSARKRLDSINIYDVMSRTYGLLDFYVSRLDEFRNTYDQKADVPRRNPEERYGC